MLNEKYIKVLYIDLTAQKVRIEQREDLMPFLGGVGVASKLFLENMKSNSDYTDPDQPVVFAIGPGAFIYPVLTKTVAVFQSPITGELGESYAGSRMAMAMLFAGYDALVITGKAKKYSYVTISDTNILFRDARALWGLGVEEAGRILRDREHFGGDAVGKRSILPIGPAGENGVAFANVTVDSYRHFGRMGLGACLGSKNLKAIMVFGNRSVPVKNYGKYFKVYREIYGKCIDTDHMAKYHDAGTPINIIPLNTSGGLPTKNMQSCTFEHAEAISGEAFAQKNLVRKMSCTGCPVGCIHIGMYRREFDKGHEYEAISVPYDYELIYALGTFIEVKTTDEIIALIQYVEDLGLDAMSAGVCLGWATEALERGYVTVDDTIVELKWGDTDAYFEAIKYLATSKNEFYRILGKGTRFAAQKYGGEDFAMQLGGLEMAGYHTGYGALVGAAVAARHSHLCNGGYSLDQKAAEFDEDEFADALFAEEYERCLTNCLVMCLFGRRIYDKKTILDALNAIGYSFVEKDLATIGKRVLQVKTKIKKELGYKQKAVKLPKRFFETPSMNGLLDEDISYRLIEKFMSRIDILMQEDF